MQVLNKQTIRQQLEKYLDQGFSLIPLKEKLPLVRWKEFNLSKQDIDSYVKQGINWGIRGGLLPNGKYLYFIDLDNKSLLSTILNLLPSGTPIVSTTRGFHLYLSWTEPVKTRRLEGLEIRGEGAYVVAPPSVHSSGKPYRFIVPLGNSLPLLDPKNLTLFNRPNVLRSLLQDDRTDISGYPFDWHAIYNGVPKGQRHNTLIRYLGILFSRWDTEKEAIAKAIEWNKKNQPPLLENELIRTVQSCYKEWGKRMRKGGAYDEA